MSEIEKQGLSEEDERREKELTSIDRLFEEIRQYCTGAELIELLAKESFNITKSYMYRNDDNFKEIADLVIKQEKDKEAARRSF